MLTETNGYLALDGKPITREEACAAGYTYYCQEHILSTPAKQINPIPDQPTATGCTNCTTRYLLIAGALILVFLVLK